MSNVDEFFEELDDDNIFLDLISVEANPVTGHYVLRAWVKDSLSNVWLESMNYYFYDFDDMDDMKKLFITHVLSHFWDFVGDEYWD